MNGYRIKIVLRSEWFLVSKTFFRTTKRHLVNGGILTTDKLTKWACAFVDKRSNAPARIKEMIGRLGISA